MFAGGSDVFFSDRASGYFALAWAAASVFPVWRMLASGLRRTDAFGKVLLYRDARRSRLDKDKYERYLRTYRRETIIMAAVSVLGVICLVLSFFDFTKVDKNGFYVSRAFPPETSRYDWKHLKQVQVGYFIEERRERHGGPRLVPVMYAYFYDGTNLNLWDGTYSETHTDKLLLFISMAVERRAAIHVSLIPDRLYRTYLLEDDQTAKRTAVDEVFGTLRRYEKPMLPTLE